LRMEELSIAEIFASIQGEGSRAGLPCAFVRLAGCNLSCRYCDTEFARQGGREMCVEEVIAEVLAFGLPLAEVTGGEPLLQEACPTLLTGLLEGGLEVLLETNGSFDLGAVDTRVVKIVDIKCPSSGVGDAMRWENIELLTHRDEVKFVLAGRDDYDWAREAMASWRLPDRCSVLFGPVYGELDPSTLAEWMLADRVPARLQLQLHKLIWGSGARGR